MEGGTRRPVTSNKPQLLQNKKKEVASIKIECPVCFEMLLPPIVLCVKGHSLCKTCKDQLHEKICPVCRASMSDSRNEALETLILKSQVSCPNEKCDFKVKAESLEDHLKQCLYRDFKCVIGTEFKNCLWSGKLSDMLAHFKTEHKENCELEPIVVHKLKNFITHRDNKVINLLSIKNKLFIFTIKVDTVHGFVSWFIQFIGLASHAKRWLYDLTIFDTTNNERKNVFTEVCQSDTKTCDEIFNAGKCVFMTLTNMETYISNNVLTYSFNVRRIPGDNTNAASKPNCPNNFAPNTNAEPHNQYPGPHNNVSAGFSGLHNNAGPSNNFGAKNKGGPYKSRSNNKPGPHNRSGQNNNPEAQNRHAGQSSRGRI